MTTIIAIEHDGGVTLGFDSLCSVGGSGFDLSQEKVFANNGTVFGVAGAVLDANIIRYADLPSPDDAGWDVDRWVTNRLIPALMEALDTRAASERHSNKIETGNHTLIIVRGRVYEWYPDTAWTRRIDGLYAVGSGARYALGALAAGASAAGALEIAAARDRATGGRLTVIQAEELL